MTLEEYLIVTIAALLSALIKNGVGVGSGIFLLPMLSLVFPAKTALALGAPIMFGSDLIGLRLYWRQWAPWRELARLLVPAIPGMLLGVWLLPIIPASAFRTGIGIFGMLYALCFLFPQALPLRLLRGVLPPPKSEGSTLAAAAYGLLGGVATMLAHAGGLVWSLYLIATQKDRRIFVGSIVIMFALTNAYKTLAFLYIGLLDMSSFWQVSTTLPAIALGAWLGSVANKRVNQTIFRNAVLISIFITSVLLTI